MSNISKRLLNGWTELHLAADAGDLARVRQAVQKTPADLNRTNKNRQTALHLAAARGYETVINELLDRQATTTLQDEEGRTALHVAATAGHARCVAALVGPRSRDSPAEKARLLAARDGQGRDALMAAVVAGKEDAVEQLVRAGMDATRCVDNSGAGVLLAAVRHEQVEVLPLLIRACGGPDLQRDPAGGGTALHAAAAKGHLRALDCLLRAGASTTTRDNAGRTASEVALAAGHHAAVRALRDGPPLSNAPAGLAPGLGQSQPANPPSQSPSPSQQPWGNLPWPPPGAGAPAEGLRRSPQVVIPDAAPPPVYYPTPPAGAPVFY